MQINWDDIAKECHLPISSPVQVGEGWDAVVFAADHDNIIKLGKRDRSKDLLVTEAVVLDLIHDHLSGRTPRLIVAPPERSAWPFGYLVQRYIAGTPLSEYDANDLTDIATQLGHTLRQLHGIDVDEMMRTRLPLLDRREWASEFGAPALKKIAGRRGAALATRLADEATRILRTSGYYDVEPVLIHNDLHSEHLLIEPGLPIGIIDWGDAGLGDPDVDFLYLYGAMGWDFIETCALTYGHQDLNALHTKLHDLLLLFALFLILFSSEYGSSDEEAFGWEILDTWVSTPT
ncbi:MAG: aminoglycoside phosphotransferase family protein [Proteobacteria bacterium]|nr:aminoglycoside phosphotransferase family protein [Pseudomonadota bacterium]